MFSEYNLLYYYVSSWTEVVSQKQEQQQNNPTLILYFANVFLRNSIHPSYDPTPNPKDKGPSWNESLKPPVRERA